MVAFYQVAKVKRECMGLTQEQFAKIVSVSPSAISKFEMGKEVSELIYKSIKFNLRLLEDHMNDDERYLYNVVKEARLLSYENDDKLMQEKLDNVMFACLRFRKYLTNKNR